MNFYLRWLEEMTKLRGLGKGLDALLNAASVSTEDIVAEKELSDGLEQIALSKIKSGKYQPRQIFDETELAELAESIKHSGVIQPVVLRKVGSAYELIAGERRWRASKIAGLKTIPAVIRKLSDQEALALSLIENIQRKDLNIIEEAHGYRRLIDEFRLKHEDLAGVTGKSRSHITNILRLLNLTSDVQEMLLLGQIDMGHARALLPLSSYQQKKLAQQIIADGLTTSMVEKLVAQIQNEGSRISTQSISKKLDPDIARLESKLADKIGMMVNIRHGIKGGGKITISYSSLDELDDFLKALS